MKTNLLLIICMLFSGNSFSIAYNIIYVNTNGPNDPGTGTIQDPYRRIQTAVNAAADTDVIEISPGVYTGSGNYNLNPSGKSITIRSTDPNNPDIVANTVIDPKKAGRGFYLANNEDANCVISGLTIRNAYTGGSGGGILIYDGGVIIKNCIISDNFAGTHGGAIFCQDGNVRITDCTISNNSSANDGGGIEHERGRSFVKNCIIINNKANGAGGGADFFNSNDVTLTNCTFSGNSANSGGALYCWGSNTTVNNSILWANTADIGPAIALNIYSVSRLSISYSDVQGGKTAVSDSAGGLIWDIGNIDTDPCFASFDLDGDPNLWDLHLQSTAGRWNSIFHEIDLNNDGIVNFADYAKLAGVWQKDGDLPEDVDNSGMVDLADLELFAQYFLANSHEDGWISDASTSPCVDAGDPNSDWQKEIWPNGKRINIGAYGGTPQASKNGNIADFDINGIVDLGDYSSLVGNWLESQNSNEDMDDNGQIGLGDIVIFQNNWLWQRKN